VADDDLDLLKAIRLCAFGAVKSKDKEDSDYTLRHIFRWFSREFHVPLPEVPNLPLEYVLTHFYECRYEQMEEDGLDEEDLLLRETKAERLAREAKAEADAAEDDEFFNEVKADTAAQIQKLSSVMKKHNLDEPMDDPDLDRPVLLPVMGERLPQAFQDIVSKMDPKLKTVPPEIKMEFVSADELGDLDSWDVIGPPKK
jgi:hypothetical protein